VGVPVGAGVDVSAGASVGVPVGVGVGVGIGDSVGVSVGVGVAVAVSTGSPPNFAANASVAPSEVFTTAAPTVRRPPSAVGAAPYVRLGSSNDRVVVQAGARSVSRPTSQADCTVFVGAGVV